MNTEEDQKPMGGVLGKAAGSMEGLAPEKFTMVRSSAMVGSLQPVPSFLQNACESFCWALVDAPYSQDFPYLPTAHFRHVSPVTASVTVFPLPVTVKQFAGYVAVQADSEDAEEPVLTAVPEDVAGKAPASAGLSVADEEGVSRRPNSCRSFLRSAA